jgi:hypothetical protein
MSENNQFLDISNLLIRVYDFVIAHSTLLDWNLISERRQAWCSMQSSRSTNTIASHLLFGKTTTHGLL